MNCRCFAIDVEGFLARWSCREPDAAAPELPAEIAAHAGGCRACALRLEAALESRRSLAALVGEGEPAAASDPYFYSRLRARIRIEANNNANRPLRALGVAWHDVAIAGLLFTATLSTFLYGISRTEVPSAAAAIAVDVPRSNPYLTPERHEGRATPVDVLVSVLLP